MISRSRICKLCGISLFSFLFISQFVHGEILVGDPNNAKDDYGKPIFHKVVRKETDLDRFGKSFEESAYQKLNQADRAMALRDAFLGTVYKSDDPKDALTPQQMRNRQIFLNQHFYQIPDEARSAIYKELLPIIVFGGDQRVIEKFFAEASRFSPQETGKLMCSQIQSLESGMPRGFGQIGTKLKSEDFGYFHPITQKFSGVVRQNLSIANYECKLNSFDEPVKVSQILSNIQEAFLEKEAEKNNGSKVNISGKQLSKTEIEAKAPQLKDCSEKKVRSMVADAIKSFSNKSRSGKASEGYYMGSQEECRIYGFVTKKNNEYQLYLNTYSSHIDKPFVFTGEQDAIDQLKFLWEQSQKRVAQPSNPVANPKNTNPQEILNEGGAGFNPFSGQKPVPGQYGNGTR